MKKKIQIISIGLIIFNLQLITHNSFAQNVGINTDGSNPETNTMLDIKSLGSTSATFGLKVKDSDGNDKVVIQSDGWVGINDNTPDALLDVNGDMLHGSGYHSALSQVTVGTTVTYFKLASLIGEGELYLSSRTQNTTASVKISYNLSTWMGSDQFISQIPIKIEAGKGWHASTVKEVYLVKDPGAPTTGASSTTPTLWVRVQGGGANSELRYSYRTKAHGSHAGDHGFDLSSTMTTTAPAGIVSTFPVTSRAYSFNQVDVGVGTSSPNARLALNGSMAQNLSTIAADDATPSVSGGNIFFTSANGSATQITDLDNPAAGQIIRIIGGSNTNPSFITDGGNFNLAGTWTANLDDVLILLVQADDDYIEIGRVDN